MKKTITLFFAIIAITAYSQSIKLLDENHNVISNTIVDIETPVSSSGVFEIPAINISGSSKTIRVLRTYVDIDATDLTQFCWAGQCYPSTTDLSNYTLAMIAGDTIDFNHYLPPGETDPGWGFHAVFNAGTECITRVVRYRFYNENNPNDSTGITLRYQCTTGIKEIDKAKATISQSFPNPTSSFSKISYSILKDFNKGSIVVKNVLGKEVKAIALVAKNGTETLDFSEFSDGIYFYSLLVDNETVATEKLVVTKK